jgi:carboxypeptidase C (cathepsin A)
MTGESYAGVYLPAIGFEFDRYNRHGGVPHIPFTSLLIGNPGNLHWAQYGSQLEYFLSHGLASDETLSRAEQQWKTCVALMEAGKDEEAFTTCEAMSTTLQSNAANVFLYDVRIFGDFYDDVLAKNMNDYLTREDVIDAFGAKSPWQNGDGTASPNPVVNALKPLLMTTAPMDWLAHLLERGYDVTIFDGVMDASSCNHLGVFSAVKAIRWSGQEEFINAKRVPWGKVPFGFTQAALGLRFVWVMNSGHLVPYDQPEGALEMLRSHLSGHF